MAQTSADRAPPAILTAAPRAAPPRLAGHRTSRRDRSIAALPARPQPPRPPATTDCAGTRPAQIDRAQQLRAQQTPEARHDLPQRRPARRLDFPRFDAYRSIDASRFEKLKNRTVPAPQIRIPSLPSVRPPAPVSRGRPSPPAVEAEPSAQLRSPGRMPSPEKNGCGCVWKTSFDFRNNPQLAFRRRPQARRRSGVPVTKRPAPPGGPRRGGWPEPDPSSGAQA